MRDWKKVNKKYVNEGELYLSFDFLHTWKKELKDLNKNKEGARYQYPESLIRFCSVIKVVFHLGYRQEQGVLNSVQKYMAMPKVPCYTQINRRISKLGLDIVDSLANPKDGQIIAIDSSGIKLYNSGEWIREKHKKKKPFLKLHIAVNIQSKQAVAIRITRENVGDNRMALPLLKESVRYASISEALMDGAYDSRKIWEWLDKKHINPVIRLRKNANRKGFGIRPRTVRKVKEIGLDSWLKDNGYGQRWQAESWYSAFKRRFGEYCYSVKEENIIKELLLKTILCNKFISD